MSEGDRILIAAVPQILMDRLDQPGEANVGQWLAESGVDTERAGLFGALQIDKAPRRNYYAYIGSLLSIADMLGTDLDVTGFPTARELDLPGSGTIGFSVDYADGHLGATLAFENHPGDLLFAGGGSMGGVAAIGILAAVAVPAYQQYTIRAKVASAHARSADIRSRVQREANERGGLSKLDVEAILDSQLTGESAQWYGWQSDPAALRIHFFGVSGLEEGSALLLLPVVEDDRIVGWTCQGDGIDSEHLPSGCR
jgi:hypothetical protein